jgi:hypothetical protein
MMLSYYKYISLTALCFLLGFTIPRHLSGHLLAKKESVKQKEKWVKLFDGKTLKGWHAIPGGEWKVEDGAIVGRSDKTDQRHGLLVTDKSYQDFEIRIQYKAIKGNSGLYFRIDEVGGVVGVNGFQAEIDPERDAGGLYETGGRAWVVQPSAEAVKKWYKPDEWNQMTVRADKGHIVVHVNGQKTAELINDPGRLKGHIALQLHGGQDMHVRFKDIELREL